MDALRTARPPTLLPAEVRAPLELASQALAWPWLARMPRGDGHPVLVLPGLFTGDGYTAPLRTWLRLRGHAARGWELGLNAGEWSIVDHTLGPLLQALAERHGQPVSLVGASLGGLYARALAHRWPAHVRCIVTLASNTQGPDTDNNVWPLYGPLLGQPVDTLVIPPPPVPSTSIFSRSDGMTQWRGCRAPVTEIHENIEVVASHHGMIHHPASIWAVADRLAQPPGQWRPFTPPDWAAGWYPDPARD